MQSLETTVAQQAAYYQAMRDYLDAQQGGDQISIVAADEALREKETKTVISEAMRPISMVAKNLGYNIRNLRWIAAKHGTEGTGKVRCEKRAGRWWFYELDILRLIESGELRGGRNAR